MSTNSRPPKFNNNRKSTQETPRRGTPTTSAWTGGRTFSPPNSSTPRSGETTPRAPAANNFPTLASANGTKVEDRNLQALSGLTGTTITLSTRTATRYEGVIVSTNREGDTTGVTLKDVKEISNPGAPLKDQLFIASTNIDQWTSGPADAKLTTNGQALRTDAEISRNGPAVRERTLEAWQPDSPGGAGGIEDETFRPISTNDKPAWNQFQANEKLFGVTATFDEEVYTTKLDRSAADFKERERKAEKLANEIMGAASSNPHIAEERGQVVDDDGNEEDKYGAVVRSNNAYVPPGARKSGSVLPVSKPDTPVVAVNGPDGKPQSNNSSKAPSPAPSNKPPADAVPAFRDFVTNEKQRLTQKRQALVKSEMDKRMAELVKFSQSFKLNKPIPDDLVPILAKDEDKQRAIKEKASKDASSNQARNIGPSASTGTVNPRGPIVVKVEAARKPSAPQPAVKPVTTVISNTPAKAAAAAGKTVVDPKKTIPMVIQAIPPFRGEKARQPSAPTSNGAPAQQVKPALGKQVQQNQNHNSNNSRDNARLNVNASSFRPNPKASAFNPSPSNSQHNASSSSSVSPKPKDSGSSAPNPFFGNRPLKKGPPVNVKDDFNPFKHNNKVVDASTVSAMWPYQGKRYMTGFPPPQHPQQQQHGGHMQAPGPPPPPPPSYEEDAAARGGGGGGGYMYYPQYGYPGQPMMPGMPPPPGFMAGPYMQPMAYPPGMPPNAMYAPPGMGQMPPPGAYMPPPPPPPGTYPPPNGGGRPSMPPTPIPAHAHPYYHHSPQLQHAVPYPMMMPPPGSVPPHQYDGSQQQQSQMGGHA